MHSGRKAEVAGRSLWLPSSIAPCTTTKLCRQKCAELFVVSRRRVRSRGRHWSGPRRYGKSIVVAMGVAVVVVT
eukprot:305864-Pyramimonas_sp.AAC.1